VDKLRKTLAFLSTDTLPLPLKENAPETIDEDGNQYSLKDKCSYSTGLGNRIWKIAYSLSKLDFLDIVVLVPNLNYPGEDYIDIDKLPFKVESYNYKAALWNWSEELDRKLKDKNFVIIQSATGVGFMNCAVLPGEVNVIVDGYVPIFAELPCALLGKSSIYRKILWNTFTEQYLSLLLRANCVLYANDRQYYYYEGQFFAIKKLDWKAFKFSPLLKVPLGIDVLPMVEKKQTTDKLRLLWYGPLYPWYQPEKVIDAVMSLSNVTLDFVGIKHPRYQATYNKFFKRNIESLKGTPNITIEEEYCSSVRDLYARYDAGIVLARDWLEEKYSIRGRVLDMLSNGLPVIMNDGNSLFNELYYLEDSLYKTTAKKLKRDLARMRENKDMLKVSQKSYQLLQKNLSWDVVVQPLIEYVQNF